MSHDHQCEINFKLFLIILALLSLHFWSTPRRSDRATIDGTLSRKSWTPQTSWSTIKVRLNQRKRTKPSKSEESLKGRLRRVDAYWLEVTLSQQVSASLTVLGMAQTMHLWVSSVSCRILHQNFFLTGKFCMSLLKFCFLVTWKSKWKPPFSAFFFKGHGANWKTQSLQYRGKSLLGFFRSNSKSPIQGKIPIGRKS